MKAKKLVCALLSLTLALGVGLCACGGNAGEGGNDNANTEAGTGGNTDGGNSENEENGESSSGEDTEENNNGDETGGDNNDDNGGDEETGENNNDNGDDNGDNNNDGEQTVEHRATVYLAGDSTVQSYENDQYIAGWGQYLQYYLSEEVTVVNCAKGGRSSRSFINEGRLYDIEDPSFKYTFKENGGNSIGDVITEGDYLFIQFGHNDDDTKATSNPSKDNNATVYDRMTPLGTPDGQGIFPVTAPEEKSPTTHLPVRYTDYITNTSAALEEIAKYGSTYYSYDCGGTYKWYLKQYVDFAREKGATPVLVTPVARVKYSNGEIIGGAGLHGENFAYVQAVRQLAQEEDCLLIDLFADTKEILETATASYGNYLMALKPNGLTGNWPTDYDTTYGNAAAGYTGIEATHYNKYGSFLSAAKVAEHILSDSSKHNSDTESFAFADCVKSVPTAYVNPSNLISKSTVTLVEKLFTTVSVTDPTRSYPDPAAVVKQINDIVDKYSEWVTAENYLEVKADCESARAAYNNLNVDDRKSVTNLNFLDALEASVAQQIEAHRPVPTSVVEITADGITTGDVTATAEYSGFKLVATSSYAVTIRQNTAPYSATYAGKTYKPNNMFDLKGGASLKDDGYRYVEFSVEKACTVTVIAVSGGDRTLNLVNAQTPSSTVAAFRAPTAVAVTSAEIENGGAYRLGSAGSAVQVLAIIIEYFD